MQLFPSRRPLVAAALLVLPLLVTGCKRPKPPPPPEQVLLDRRINVPAEGPYALPFMIQEAHHVRILVTPATPRNQAFTLELLLPDDVRNFTLNRRLEEIHPLLKVENVPKVDQRALIVTGEWDLAFRNPAKEPLPLHVKLIALPE